MASQERDPRAYELMTVFVPDISEEDTLAQVEKVSTYIGNAGGSITETLTDSPWGRRRLAYTIRYNGTDYRDGFYTVYHFDSRPSDLTELERDLKLDVNVMRYLLVHDDPKAGEKPQEGDEAAEDTASEGEPATEAPASEAAAQAEAPTEAPAEAPAEETSSDATESDADAAADAESNEAASTTTEQSGSDSAEAEGTTETTDDSADKE